MAMFTSSDKNAPVINMTPMIDVLLVLIIIFMVIQSVPQGLHVAVPQGPAGPDHGRPLIIQIADDGALRLNQEDVTRESLGPRLAEIFKTRAERACFVKA